MIILVFSGIVLWIILPGGFSGLKGAKFFLGLNRDFWNDLHIVSGIVFIVSGIVHILLNWNWIKNVTKIIIRRRISR